MQDYNDIDLSYHVEVNEKSQADRSEYHVNHALLGLLLRDRDKCLSRPHTEWPDDAWNQGQYSMDTCQYHSLSNVSSAPVAGRCCTLPSVMLHVVLGEI